MSFVCGAVADTTGLCRKDLKHAPLGITYLPIGKPARGVPLESLSPEERRQRQEASTLRLEAAKRRLEETKRARAQPGWKPVTPTQAAEERERDRRADAQAARERQRDDAASLFTVDSQASTLVDDGASTRRQGTTHRTGRFFSGFRSLRGPSEKKMMDNDGVIR